MPHNTLSSCLFLQEQVWSAEEAMAGTFFLLHITEGFLLNESRAGWTLATGDTVQAAFGIHGDFPNVFFPLTESGPFGL